MRVLKIITKVLKSSRKSYLLTGLFEIWIGTIDHNKRQSDLIIPNYVFPTQSHVYKSPASPRVDKGHNSRFSRNSPLFTTQCTLCVSNGTLTLVCKNSMDTNTLAYNKVSLQKGLYFDLKTIINIILKSYNL